MTLVRPAGINDFHLTIVARGGHKNDSLLFGGIDAACELLRSSLEIEAHVHDGGVVLRGVVDRTNDVG